MIENLKPFYNKLLTPVALVIGRMGIHPNIITLFGVALYGVVAWLSAKGHWYMSALTAIVGACMDGMDGLTARNTHKKSLFGAVLDSTSDRITEILWLGGLLLFYLQDSSFKNIGVILCFLAITGSLMVSYVKARAEGVGLVCKSGLFQRPERLIVLIVCQILGVKFMLWGLAILSVLTWITVVQRMIITAIEAKGKVV